MNASTALTCKRPPSPLQAMRRQLLRCAHKLHSQHAAAPIAISSHSLHSLLSSSVSFPTSSLSCLPHLPLCPPLRRTILFGSKTPPAPTPEKAIATASQQQPQPPPPTQRATPPTATPASSLAPPPSDPLRPLTSSVVPSTASSSRGASPAAVSLSPLFISRATRSYSLGRHRNIQITPTKLNDICRLVRGLAAYEAMAQCALSPKKKARLVGACIRTALTAGVNNFQMNADRLYVAEAIVGAGTHLKRVDWKGRGRTGTKRRYFSHLTIILKEQPTLLAEGEKLQGMWGVQTRRNAGRSHRGGIEVRVGRKGRKVWTVERARERVRQYAEAKRERGQKVPLQLPRRKAVVIRP